MIEASAVIKLNKFLQQLSSEGQNIRHKAADAIFESRVDLRDFELTPIDPEEALRLRAIETRFKDIDQLMGGPELREKLDTARERNTAMSKSNTMLKQRNAALRVRQTKQNKVIRTLKHRLREVAHELRSLKKETRATRKISWRERDFRE